MHVAATMNPAAGGVPVAVAQLSRALEHIGQRSEIVSLDAPDMPFLTDREVGVCALGPSHLKYAYNSRLRGYLEERAPDFDMLIAHGIWQYNSLAVRLASRKTGVPYLVYAHGQLDPWFKRKFPFKHAKKWLYWPWAGYRLLRDASAVVFTSEMERRIAHESFWLYQAHEAVAGLGIEESPGDPREQEQAFLDAHSDLRDKRLILFLSRIDEKKGCDLLIEAFARVADRNRDLHLVIAGPDQHGLRTSLEELARMRGLTDRITWTGMLSGKSKWGAYRAADAFILPSHSENFGIVVVEALACGVPVLITDKVNIWPEVAQFGAALVERDTLSGTVALIERWVALGSDEADDMRRRARICFETRFKINEGAKRLVELVEEYAGHGR